MTPMLFSSLKAHVFSYPTPLALNLSGGFGSALGILFLFQSLIGVFLAALYTPSSDAFSRIDYIVTEVNGGYLLKYLHLNLASIIFIIMYTHVYKAINYNSWLTLGKVGTSGVLMFLLTILTAFLGYVLPWGQMSYGAATVITNLVTSIPFIGAKTLPFIHGAFSVDVLTLNRFFALHFLFAIIILVLAGLHVYFLHSLGSTSPEGRYAFVRGSFSYFYFYKDLQLFIVTMLALSSLALLSPNMLNHPDNFIEANPLVTPAHIVPEGYFLPFYAMLRAVPNKTLGVAVLVAAILVFALMPILSFSRRMSYRSAVLLKVSLEQKKIFLAYVFIILGYFGTVEAVAPYTSLALLFTVLYYLTVLFVAAAPAEKTL